jgi:site-specific DNA recombinase
VTINLSSEGAANEDVVQYAHERWQEVAAEAGVSLQGFDAGASLLERIAWIERAGLQIATIYSRFSTKCQHSTRDQVRECIEFSARNGMYVPPEYISADEAVKGKRERRAGLARMKDILEHRHATVLLVFKASRLFRVPYRGYQLLQEQVVEEGLRAVSVSQQIDTDDKKAWKIQMQVHGLVDDMLLDAIADHVRSGLRGLHLAGYVTGAIGVGYRRLELSDAPVTNRGLPRTVPEIDPEAAELIRQHATFLLDGVPLRECWRRWVDVMGPYDPRATTGRMSYPAYRRLWSNIRLTGRWEFGRMRNQFSTKRDYTKQVEQPSNEISAVQLEELRILDDDTFAAIQDLLQANKLGPRVPRKGKPVELCDLTTEFFFCAHCSETKNPVRFYQTGSGGRRVMHCKNNDLCPCLTKVNREDAVRAVCEAMQERLQDDTDLIEQVIARAQQIDRRGDDQIRTEISSLEKKVRSLTNRIDDLHDFLGEGTDDDRRETQARIRSVRGERSALQDDLRVAKRALEGTSGTLTAADIRSNLRQFVELLEDGASGNLGGDAVYRALRLFRDLTRGKIWVHVEQRPGRKGKNVRGVFHMDVLRAVQDFADTPTDADANEVLPSREITVWLRKPPRLDLLAERVHQLIDIENQSMRDAAKTLQSEGHQVNSGNVWYSYQRWYELQGTPVPKRPYNNGQPRKSA